MVFKMLNGILIFIMILVKITKLYNYCIQNKIAMTSDFVEIFRKMESN